jgi:hypothetical protein
LSLAAGIKPKIPILAIAMATLLWRISTTPPRFLWQDWVTILTLYGVYSLYRYKTEKWSAVSAATSAFLLGIYAIGQVPHLLKILGLRV